MDYTSLCMRTESMVAFYHILDYILNSFDASYAKGND